jgi:16S rRNA (guanine966-N2)-methyltransferase
MTEQITEDDVTRIVAGDVGGRQLIVPKGDTTRPTTDRVREAVFGSLDARGRVQGAVVLDLYCGSGALGLEASSRGAGSVVLVDSGRAAVEAARRNVSALGLMRVTVVLSSVQRFLAQPPAGDPATLVFADPPYAAGQEELGLVLTALADRRRLAPGALVLVERSSRSVEPTWPPGLVRQGVRRYGETAVWEAEWTPGRVAS